VIGSGVASQPNGGELPRHNGPVDRSVLWYLVGPLREQARTEDLCGLAFVSNTGQMWERACSR